MCPICILGASHLLLRVPELSLCRLQVLAEALGGSALLLQAGVGLLLLPFLLGLCRCLPLLQLTQRLLLALTLHSTPGGHNVTEVLCVRLAHKHYRGSKCMQTSG